MLRVLYQLFFIDILAFSSYRRFHKLLESLHSSLEELIEQSKNLVSIWNDDREYVINEINRDNNCMQFQN